ncbi:TPA: hypothetical protein ACH3X1_010150 [Trebouxia sp. C0004]
MDANAPSGDAESADLVDLSKEDSSDKGKKRSSTTEFEPSAVKRVKLSYHDPASSRSSSPGRPQNTLWPFFDKSFHRRMAAWHTILDQVEIPDGAVAGLSVSNSGAKQLQFPAADRPFFFVVPLCIVVHQEPTLVGISGSQQQAQPNRTHVYGLLTNLEYTTLYHCTGSKIGHTQPVKYEDGVFVGSMVPELNLPMLNIFPLRVVGMEHNSIVYEALMEQEQAATRHAVKVSLSPTKVFNLSKNGAAEAFIHERNVLKALQTSTETPGIHVLSKLGIGEFWAAQAANTGMGRKFQHALQFAEDSNYDTTVSLKG